MKKHFLIAATIAAFGLLTIGAAVCPAQSSDIIVGGYGETSTSNERVVEAAKFAVAAQSKMQKGDQLKLVSILNAEQQVVAGINYRMCLALTSNNAPEQASATVYLDLQNKFSLSNWTAGNCFEDGKSADDETVTFKGGLEVGKTDSVILYVGEETGDYAAFCFPNKSEAGRAILAACKNGEQCEFTGKVNFESACEVKSLEADLSASGKIMSVEAVKSVAAKMDKPMKKAEASLAPDVLVKNLYASEKAGASPFFQTNDRALVDKYFGSDLADLIWDDAIFANGEVGALDFDPLYNSQDSEITALVIGKPVFDKVSEVATVTVSFKNFGKANKVQFYFEQNEAGIWKIIDIVYGKDFTLKGLLFDAKLAMEEMPKEKG